MNESTNANCPACGCAEDIWLGQLGQRVHVRCRDCGMDYSYLMDDEDDGDCDDDGRFDTDAAADEDCIEPDGQPDEMQEWHDFDPDC